jgi:alpha-D-ribose 1-methylphosphonate 5-triphosphate synthase subunit PhnL
MPAHLSVQELEKKFTLHLLERKSLDALQEVTFDVEHGECLAVVGRSGSGKSTLLRCLHRRYLPSAGRLSYRSVHGAIDLASATEREILELRESELGYVSQFLWAIPRTVAADVVADPLLRRGVEPEQARRRAAATLSALGLQPAVQQTYPATMSGGERQRVNLARALVTKPRLLLLDEPTGALDAHTRSLAVEGIKALRESGTTMIGVFHDLETVRELADRVLVLERGRVSWIGSVDDAGELPMAA